MVYAINMFTKAFGTLEKLAVRTKWNKETQIICLLVQQTFNGLFLNKLKDTKC